ncbi:hypothetical protein E8D34_19090 [Nocardioides sp. GY 10113]|uniref:IPT/TIG domain-containing protein n=1 Tax=Nocardioides sp. GY 10113 TaxID=2569761 RepID=UPI0010A8EF3A|nr:IPT/TIG domain-containing protein [Nocardioides sp. GY 10113]TIC80489.1 hypothetical protein E8D34_19090 [Nocardioides sp. GY 10113]
MRPQSVLGNLDPHGAGGGRRTARGRRAARTATVLACLAALGLAACSSGAPDSAPDADSADDPVGSSSDGEDSASTADKGLGTTIIEWVVSLGPSAPGGNHNVPLDAYLSLVKGNCRHVVDVAQYADEPYNRLLYEGVGSACLAAFEGESERWAVAEQNLDLLADQRDRTGCYGRGAFDLLDALVAAHRSAPDAELVRQEGTSGSGCVLVEGISPDRGSAAGGYPVTVTGSHFPDHGLITIGGTVVGFDSTDGGTRIEFTMPPLEVTGEQYIVVDGEDEYWNSAAEFTVEPVETPDGSATGTGPSPTLPSPTLTGPSSPTTGPPQDASLSPAAPS